MKSIVRVLFTGVLVLLPLSYVCSAEVLQPRLILDKMKVITPTEREGDELYFDISIYQPNQPTQYLRVPAKPVTWSLKAVDNLKQVSLWSQPLQSGQSITLVVSLLDSDGSVLNPDDLIGSMRVDLKNEKGKLQTNWSMPNRVERLGKQAMQKFELTGAGRYDVYLSVNK